MICSDPSWKCFAADHEATLIQRSARNEAWVELPITVVRTAGNFREAASEYYSW